MIKKIKGKVLYISENTIYISKSYKIYKSTDNGNTWVHWISLPINWLEKVKMSIPLISRLLRKSIHHLILSKDASIIIANKNSYLIEETSVKLIEPLHGSRPMVLCKTRSEDIYYGEYRSNKERSGVSIWKFNKSSSSWISVYTFHHIRHIHGVFYDEYTNNIWVTTGDDNNEASINCTTDNFETLEMIAGGSQQLRAVQLLFGKDYIYYGSDAPDEVNYIYKMNRKSKEITKLQEVGSSIFYGTKINNSYFFSTAVEPSTCNTTQYVELWRSDNGDDWYIYKKIKKDIWSMKYFQYGQIFFPYSESQNNFLYYSTFSTKNSGMSVIDTLVKDETVT